MDKIIEILGSYGLAGLVILALAFVIWKYMLPNFTRIAETNERQAQTLIVVSENLASMHKDIPKHIKEAKEEIINVIDKKIPQ